MYFNNNSEISGKGGFLTNFQSNRFHYLKNLSTVSNNCYFMIKHARSRYSGNDFVKKTW